jgi:hypothetical protein
VGGSLQVVGLGWEHPLVEVPVCLLLGVAWVGIVGI